MTWDEWKNRKHEAEKRFIAFAHQLLVRDHEQEARQLREKCKGWQTNKTQASYYREELQDLIWAHDMQERPDVVCATQTLVSAINEE